MTPKQVNELCAAAILPPEKLEMIDKKYRHLMAENPVTGQSLHDYLRLLKYSGGRENETTMQRCPNVTWSRAAEFDGNGADRCVASAPAAGR